MTEYHRNWPAICACSDPDLKYLITWTNNKAVLKGLRQGFSPLFSEVPTPLRVPYSALQRRALLSAVERDRMEGTLGDPNGGPTFASLLYYESFVAKLHAFPFPKNKIIKWKYRGEGKAADIPEEILAQLRGKKLRAGMTVVYKKKTYVVLGLGAEKSTDFDDMAFLGTILNRKFYFTDMYLVPVGYIDLDA